MIDNFLDMNTQPLKKPINKFGILFVLIVIAVFSISCSESDEFEDNEEVITGVRGKYLVDKIYDYHNKLLAEYIYDKSNRLIKKTVTDRLIEPNRTIDRKWEDEFEYTKGRVSKIKTYTLYIDNSPVAGFTQENNTETIFEYDSKGRLVKAGDSDFNYENGYIANFYAYTMGPCFYRDTIVYDNSKNITKHIFVNPEMNMFFEPIEGTYQVDTRYYEYDNNPKPNFGLDYLFAYNPFPYSEVPDLIRGISKNNMTNAEKDGYIWIYTYNENGLPETIETQWIDIETSEPMLMRISYKQIE